MRNLYQQFRALIPTDALLIGTVQQQHGDGTSTIELPAGDTIRVTGTSVLPGGRAFVQSGRIQGEAPELPLYQVTIF